MLSTFLTREWGLRFPLVGAPMSPISGGKLTAAISLAGAMGMIGVDSRESVEQLRNDAAEARDALTNQPWGIGLMSWAVEARPELLDAAIAMRPFAISLSFGDVAPHVKRVREAGIKAIVQVQSHKSALAADAAGADLIVAQGTEAGGHTGSVGTLPLLQIVLDSVRAPVLAAGGIATGRGLAAVLAAGAQGAWLGTPFLVATEARNSAAARARVLASDETQTVLTSAFDRAQGIPWPSEFRGRALSNAFLTKWDRHEDELAKDPDAVRQFSEQKRAENYDVANLYAGQSVGTLHAVRPAAAIVTELMEQAEIALRRVADIVQ